jgi:hypothetical protein
VVIDGRELRHPLTVEPAFSPRPSQLTLMVIDDLLQGEIV